VLVALNAWVIYYAASLRAYGLGSAMIALCAAAGWHFVQHPGKRSWLIFAAAAVLSVQSLYQNSVLVAAVCAGAGAVALRRKQFKLTGFIFFAGLTAAISLLPYWHDFAGMPQGAAPLRVDFDRYTAFNNLDTLLAYPLPQFFWVWTSLAGFVLLRAVIGFFSARQPMNAAWTAFTACSPFARSMTTEILISLVEIMSMFTPSFASVSNSLPATPVCDFMPTPTMDSLPIFSAVMTSRKPISFFKPAMTFCALSKSGLSAVKEMSVAACRCRG
jgi:hypothetical protein